MSAHPMEARKPPRKRKRPTTKYWETKTLLQANQAKELMLNNPALLAVLLFASYYAWTAWKKKLTITSVFRLQNDPNGIHGAWRAVDCRVHDAGRDGPESVEITASEWQELIGMINRTFSYGRTWLGKKTVVAHYRGGGTANEKAAHVHIQTPRKAWR